MATAESININFERRDPNSPQKSHPPLLPPRDDFLEIYFSFGKCNRFFFISFTQNFVLCLQITTATSKFVSLQQHSNIVFTEIKTFEKNKFFTKN